MGDPSVTRFPRYHMACAAPMDNPNIKVFDLGLRLLGSLGPCRPGPGLPGSQARASIARFTRRTPCTWAPSPRPPGLMSISRKSRTQWVPARGTQRNCPMGPQLAPQGGTQGASGVGRWRPLGSTRALARRRPSGGQRHAPRRRGACLHGPNDRARTV